MEDEEKYKEPEKIRGENAFETFLGIGLVAIIIYVIFEQIF